MRKILFLDFDGVLNCETTEERYGSMFLGLEPEKINLLNEIVERTSVEIVISSTWKMSHTHEELAGLLEGGGFKHGDKIIGCTPDIYAYGKIIQVFAPRHEEIQKWLDESGSDVDSFIILDDIGDMGALQGHLVQTSWESGLCREVVEKVVEGLKKGAIR